MGPGARHLEDHGYAGAVVGRAVVDVVAGHIGDEAEVVVVGGVEDGLVCMSQPWRGPWVTEPGEDGDDVGALEGADSAGYGGFEADGEFDGVEAGLAGGFEFFVEVEVADREELAGNVQLDPAGGLQAGVGVVAEKGRSPELEC